MSDLGSKTSPRGVWVLAVGAALCILATSTLAAGPETKPVSNKDKKLPASKAEDPKNALYPAPKNANDIERYNENIKKSYNYRFGKNPWLPSQTQSETGEFIPANAFPKAEYCAKCHEEAHREWRESAHANAFRVPFYKRSVDILNSTKGIEYSRHCEGCHNPIALFSGALTKGSKLDRTSDNDGVTCMVCHSIRKVQNTSGIGSFVMGVPSVILNEDGTPRPGVVPFDEILAKPKLHAAAVMKDFYRSAEFCATCHKAAVPRQLNDYKWLRAFTVYDEWQQSSWSKENPLPFYKKETVSNCQTCHMKPVEATSDYGAKEGKLKSHRFLGASTAIPVFYGFDEQLKKITEFLQDDLLNVDIFGISKGNSDEVIAPLDRSNFTLAADETVTMHVYIQNKGIGHSLVPEQRDFYEAWVEFKVTDADGKTITYSGFLKPDGYLDDRAHSFTNRLISKDGKFLDLHQVWQTRTIAYNNTISPGRSDLVRYQFALPDGVRGPLKVEAKVNYRRFRQGWLEYALQKKGVQYPVVVMASKTLVLNVGENVGKSDAPGQKPEMKEVLRWNNYGIALLGELQYAKAVEAFQKVVELNPEYADGYINIAAADIPFEKYEPALKNLEKALAMRPNDARALYYKATVYRIQGRLDDAIELFKQVIAQYPRGRDAHRELGFTYYQQKKYELARASYESLQGIDPDDLAAHYNLMLIYRRLGMKEKSAEQAAYFSDKKDDPGANAFALEFLRANPQISNESVPWHIHSDLSRQKTAAASGDND